MNKFNLWDDIESIQTDSIGFTKGEKDFLKDVFENENFTDIYNAIDKIDSNDSKKMIMMRIMNDLTKLLNAKSLKQSKKDDKKRILKEAMKILNETNTIFTPPNIKERRPNSIRDLQYELINLENQYNPTKNKLRNTLNSINLQYELKLSNNQLKAFLDNIKITQEHIKNHIPRY